MAITYAGYINQGRISAVLNELLHEDLYDDAALGGTMTYYPWMGTGAATMNVTKVQPGYSMAAAGSETVSNFSDTDPTASQFQLTASLHGLRMSSSGLFVNTGIGQALDMEYVYTLLMGSLDLTLTDLLVTLFAGVTGNVGTSGAPMTTDDLYDALY